MSYFGTTKIGKIYLGSTEIAKAYLGNDLVFQSGGGGSPLTRLAYFDTDGLNYILTPVIYEPGHSYTIVMDVQFLNNTGNKGTGWNAGGALAVFGNNAQYGNGSSLITPVISVTNRITATISIGSGTTTYSAIYNGNTSTGSRSNSSLATYAGSTGYPIGCMTNSGGTVPTDGLAMRIRSVQISKDGVIVFDGLPYISNESVENEQGQTVPVGTVGLYDTVTQKFYTNRGSGNDFTPGYNS